MNTARINISVLLAVFLVTQVSPIAAESDMSIAEAKNYVAGELCECAAFFMIWQNSVAGMETEQAKQIGERMEQLSLAATSRALQFIDQQLVKARVRSSGQQMLEKIDGDASRIAILNAEYMMSCMSLMKDTPGRIKDLAKEGPNNGK